MSAPAAVAAFAFCPRRCADYQGLFGNPLSDQSKRGQQTALARGYCSICRGVVDVVELPAATVLAP